MNAYLTAVVVALWIALRWGGKRLDRRSARHQRQALDSTVRWAYYQGCLDGLNNRVTDDGPELAVIEFRATFGDTLREVPK